MRTAYNIHLRRGDGETGHVSISAQQAFVERERQREGKKKRDREIEREERRERKTEHL